MSSNPFRISLARWLADEGYENVEELEEALSGGTVTALCSEHCTIEPDGHCEHGCPSPLVALGLI